jgi:L-arabinonolactonase
MLSMAEEPTVALDCRNCLGESIVWDDRARLLYWANIHDGEIWAWNPFAEKQPIVMKLPERIGALGLREQGGLALALASGFALFDPVSRSLERLADAERDLPTTRLNDGRVGPDGRFLCGGMDEGSPQRPLSSLYSLGRDRTPRKLLGQISCANSLCWSPDGAVMYFTDMPTRRIDKFDYDVATGVIANRGVFADLSDQPGSADGSITDADGFLWNAQWGGSKLVRYRPDGSVEREVPLPVSNPTCLAFGGPDLDILFVTSAWFSLTEKQRAREPHAGSLFVFRPGVRGRVEPHYIG